MALRSKDIVVTLKASEKRFETPAGDETAYIDFAWHHDTLVLLYVYVPIPYRGLGYSTALIEYAMQYAMDKKVKIKVYCSYIRGYLQRHPEHDHLLVD